MTRSLEGRVVAVTGGARGIGYATARDLIAQGAKVAIGDVDAVQLEKAAADLGPATSAPLDVTSVASFTGFLDTVESRLGPLDVLVNNAGIMPTGTLAAESDEVTWRILAVNVFGPITGTKLALHRMLPRARGHIVNVASLAGEVPIPGLATYCGSKAGVLAFTDAVRLECRGTGVHISAVLPSQTRTDLTVGIAHLKGLPNAEPEQIAAAVVRTIRRPRPKVRVTRTAAAAVNTLSLLPRPVAEGIGRALGKDTAIGEIDHEAREFYERRARGAAVPTQERHRAAWTSPIE